MNITQTRIEPAARAPFRGYSLVRRLLLACLAGVVVMPLAQAGPGERQMRREQAAQRQYDDRQMRQDDGRQFEERRQREMEARAEEQRRQFMQEQRDAQNADAFRRSGRLTPDE